MSPLIKTVVPPSNERKFVLGWMPKRPPPPSYKYRENLNVFYTCFLWVRTAAILSSIGLSCNNYGFLRKLIKTNLFSAPITEQFIFHLDTLQHVSSFL